ncbi:hypothetical protein GBA52_012251 [Prunus armeniaca]|nr:hypothetical protein GBA52_012251 [Prunus armeniaca]
MSASLLELCVAPLLFWTPSSYKKFHQLTKTSVNCFSPICSFPEATEVFVSPITEIRHHKHCTYSIHLQPPPSASASSVPNGYTLEYNPNEHGACTRRGRRLQTQSQPFRFDFQFRLLRPPGSTPKKDPNPPRRPAQPPSSAPAA